jgi:hypothetical protein
MGGSVHNFRTVLDPKTAAIDEIARFQPHMGSEKSAEAYANLREPPRPTPDPAAAPSLRRQRRTIGGHRHESSVSAARPGARHPLRPRRHARGVDGVIGHIEPHESEALLLGTGQNPDGTVADSTGNDLIYHGGNAGSGAIGVETKPAVYLVYWGPQWATGFTTADSNGKLYSSKTLQTYVNSFFKNVGGSGWANIQTQYCKDVLAGSTTCVGGSGFITNPTGQLKGVWTDSRPVPDDIIASGLAQNLADDPIADEAVRASAHFKYDANATYIVLTPPTTIATGQPS